MKFANILQHLYCEPWLISPERHAQLCAIVQDHMTGAAHAEGGRLDQFRADMPVKAQSEITARERLERVLTYEGNIAIIEVSGVIGHRLSLMTETSGAIGTETIERALEAALSSPQVEGILLDIDSGGGAVVNVPELADAIASAKFEKPVVAFTSSVMGSAAYWIGCGADMIVSTGSAVVGSIGVYSAFIDQSKAFEQAGLKTEIFKTGTFKGMGIAGLPLTDEQKELLQDRVEEIFTDFTASVLFNRDVPNSALQGQTFQGSEAKELGLVDVIGGIDVAMAELQDIITARRGL